MNLKNPLLILVIFITVLIAAYVELNFGGYGSSGYIALIFFIISLILLSKLVRPKMARTRLKASKKLILLGVSIIIVDILYNLKNSSDLQTMDVATIFLGLSFIIINIKNKSLSMMGEFGVYFCSIFLSLFLFVYAIPSHLGSNVYDYYGYYATTFPSVSLLKAFGFSIQIDSLTTFHAYGVENIYYKIDLGCFGFYSMLLIISTIIAYWLIVLDRNPGNLAKIVIILIVASYLSNLLRIMLLVSIGYYYGQSAMQFFHTFLGWVLFAFIVLPVTYIYLRTIPSSTDKF